MKKSFLIISMLILSLICASYPAYATTTLTIQPDISDAYVRSSAPDGNFGGQNELRLTNYSIGADTRVHRTYIKFNISSIPADVNIIQAVLGLRATATVNPYQTYSYYVNNQTWSENDITWNSQMCFSPYNATYESLINATTCSATYDDCTKAADFNNDTWEPFAGESEIDAFFNYTINEHADNLTLLLLLEDLDASSDFAFYCVVEDNTYEHPPFDFSFTGSKALYKIYPPIECFNYTNLVQLQYHITTGNSETSRMYENWILEHIVQYAEQVSIPSTASASYCYGGATNCANGGDGNLSTFTTFSSFGIDGSIIGYAYYFPYGFGQKGVTLSVLYSGGGGIFSGYCTHNISQGDARAILEAPNLIANLSDFDTVGGLGYKNLTIPSSCLNGSNYVNLVYWDDVYEDTYYLWENRFTDLNTYCNDTPMDSQLWQGALGDWFTINVKPAIDIERLLANENVSVLIVDNSTVSATTKFSSKEGADSPILNVTYSVPSNITVTLSSPTNASSSEVTTPTFEFVVSSTYTGEPLQAYVYVNGNLVGSNTSVVNGTSTNITSNTTLTPGDYQWYVFVIQDLSTGQSGNMAFTITVPVIPPTPTQQAYTGITGIIPIIMALGILVLTLAAAIAASKGAISSERIVYIFLVVILGVIFTSIAVTLLG